MREILRLLRDQYDFILIDSCPTIAVSDAVLLSNNVDGVIFVVDSSQTPRRLAQRALVRLNRAHAPIIGAVLNRVNMSDYAYYYGNHYPYYDAEAVGMDNHAAFVSATT